MSSSCQQKFERSAMVLHANVLPHTFVIKDDFISLHRIIFRPRLLYVIKIVQWKETSSDIYTCIYIRTYIYKCLLIYQCGPMRGGSALMCGDRRGRGHASEKKLGVNLKSVKI